MQASVLIDNQWQLGAGPLLQSSNPLNAESLWHKASASVEQVQQAVVSAGQAQMAWGQSSLQSRIAIVERFATLLIESTDELSQAIALETGKPDWEATTEVGAMANKAAISIRSLRERTGERQGEQLQLAHRPHGVMAVFGPYNFPGHLPNGHIIPALLAGNAVVFKPSEQTPWVAEMTTKLWLKAGLPAGVLNLVQGGREQGEALAACDIDALLFTGSSAVGRVLHRQMAERPEVLLALEMGGNNPLIVDTGVDIDAAVDVIVQSAYLSAGQRCTCARRLILIESSDSQRLLDALVARLQQVIVAAHNAQPEPFMGPVINPQTAQCLLDYQAQLVAKGAKLLHDMAPQDATLTLLKPGLLDVTALSERDDDEWFGPLLQVVRVDSFEQALAEANNTRFGLAAGLISDDQQHQRQFLTQIRAGVVSINKPTAGASSELPFGGVGASGNHRPSAFYAADYCAWPQAQSLGPATFSASPPLLRGLKT